MGELVLNQEVFQIYQNFRVNICENFLLNHLKCHQIKQVLKSELPLVTLEHKKNVMIQEQILVLSTGYCLNVSNSTMAQEKSGSN